MIHVYPTGIKGSQQDKQCRGNGELFRILTSLRYFILSNINLNIIELLSVMKEMKIQVILYSRHCKNQFHTLRKFIFELN
jgi:hypothetical protein